MILYLEHPKTMEEEKNRPAEANERLGLIDFHTHRCGCASYRGTDTIVVQSTFLHESPHPRADYYTTGVHPMDTPAATEVLDGGPELLRSVILEKRDQYSAPLLALGELGWDKRSSTLSPREQSLLVSWQLDLAEELALPVVFHMVGHWDLLMAEHRRRSPHTPWWVHGFRGKAMLLRQLQEAGLFVSLSPRFSWEGTPQASAFLLETDEEIGSLAASYRRAATALGIPSDQLARDLLRIFSTLLPQ